MITQLFIRRHKRLFYRHDKELESICNGMRGDIQTLRELIENMPSKEEYHE